MWTPILHSLAFSPEALQQFGMTATSNLPNAIAIGFVILANITAVSLGVLVLIKTSR